MMKIIGANEKLTPAAASEGLSEVNSDHHSPALSPQNSALRGLAAPFLILSEHYILPLESTVTTIGAMYTQDPSVGPRRAP